MLKPIWRQQDRPLAARLLADILQQHVHEHAITVSPKIELLLRALVGMATSESVTVHLLKHALDQARHAGVSDLDGVERSLAELMAIASARPTPDTPTWAFAYFLPLRLLPPGTPPARFELLGQETWIGSCGASEGLCAWLTNCGVSIDSEWGRRIRIAFSECEACASCITVCSRGADEGLAELEARSVVDLVRSVAELVWQTTTIRMTFGGGTKLQSRTLIPAGEFFWRSSPEGVAGWWPFDSFVNPGVPPQRQEEPTGLGLTRWQSVEMLLARFPDSPQEGSTKSLMTDLVRLFARAMEPAQPQFAFLTLWQVLEALALADGVRDKGGEVCSRMGHLESRLYGGMQAGTLVAVLRDCMRRRNRIVHHGHHRVVGDNDVEMLRDIAMAAIRWLSEVENDLPTKEHLRQLYSWRTKSPKDRARVEQVFRYLEQDGRAD